MPAPAAQAPAPEPLLRTATFVRPKSNVLAPEAQPITRASLSVKPATPTIGMVQPKIGNSALASSPVKSTPVKSTTVTFSVAKPVLKPLAVAQKAPAKTAKLALASLLPSDIGALAAAESKGRKAPAPRESR
jgi:hypothetical protein